MDGRFMVSGGFGELWGRTCCEVWSGCSFHTIWMGFGGFLSIGCQIWWFRTPLGLQGGLYCGGPDGSLPFSGLASLFRRGKTNHGSGSVSRSPRPKFC